MRGLATLLLGAALAACPSTGQAQTCGSESSRVEAAAMFEEAGRAAQEERWETSREAFEQAYALSCAPSALFNQAVALRQLRRYAEAVAVLERFFAAHPEVDAGLREAAQEELRESEARVARLDVEADAGELLLDGQRVTRDGAGQTSLAVNPGPHTLRLRAEGSADTWQGTLTEGQRVEVRLHVEAAPSEVSAPPPAPPTSGGSISAGGPVFLGLGVAAGAAAAIVGVLALTRNDELRAMCEGTACPPMAEGLADEVRDLSLATDVLWPSAAVLGAIGLVWLIVEAAGGSDAEAARRRERVVRF